MSRGLHTTKTGEVVYVTPMGNGHYQLRYSDGHITVI